MPFDPYFSSTPDPEVERKARAKAYAKAYQARLHIRMMHGKMEKEEANGKKALSPKEIKKRVINSNLESPEEFIDRVSHGMRLGRKTKASFIVNPGQKHLSGFSHPKIFWDKKK